MESETTPSGAMNFGSKKNKAAARSKKSNVKRNLSDNQQRKAEASKQPKDQKRIDALIEDGRKLVELHFQGYSEIERANIKADLDDDLPFRLAEIYDDRIERYAQEEFEMTAPAKALTLAQVFAGGISISLAVKLNLSATDSEKQQNWGFNSLNNISIRTPKRLATIIDALGKTDLPNDNHFRINNQHFAAKRHIVRGTALIFGKDKIEEYIRKDRITDNNFEKLATAFNDPDVFPNMIDDSTSSLERLKQIGRDVYSKATDQNIEFTISDKKYLFRLPKFDIPEDLTLSKVGEILSNAFFDMFKTSSADIVKAMSGLILMIAKHEWLSSPTKKLSELEKAFNGTYFQEITFAQIMINCNVWNLNDFFHTSDINSLAIDAIHKWNTADSKTLGKFLDMVEISYSEHGDEAQLIQIDRTEMKPRKTRWGWNVFRMEKRTNSTTPLKIKGDSALLGIFSGLTKNLKFTSDFEAKHNKTNRELSQLYLRKDFIN